MCEEREREKAKKGEGRARRAVRERMMGQVWNLHTLLVVRTIGIFCFAAYVTLLTTVMWKREKMWVSSSERMIPTKIIKVRDDTRMCCYFNQDSVGEDRTCCML